MAKKIIEVEIGLLNRESGEIFTTMTEKYEQIFYSVGMGVDPDTDKDQDVIYAFESNAELFRLKADSSGAKIDREFRKRYKPLKVNTVLRYREEGKITVFPLGHPKDKN